MSAIHEVDASPELERLDAGDFRLPGPVSVVMLVHNEADVIEQVVQSYYREIISRAPGSEFIIAEDGSRDGTREILARLRRELPLTVIHREERRGYTRALRDALTLPKHDLVFLSDSDGQHDPRDFWRLARRIANADMVVGFKRPRRDPLYRVAISRLYNVLIGLVFGLWLHDVNCGFRMMKRPVVNDLLRDEWQLNACIASELSIRAFHRGYTIAEVPVRHLRRPFGTSRGLPLTHIPRAVLHVLREFRVMKRRMKAGTF